MKRNERITIQNVVLPIIVGILCIISTQIIAQKAKILLPTERENFIIDKYNNNEETWAYLKYRVDLYLNYDESDGATQPNTA